MILDVFSNLNKSMILWFEAHILAKNIDLQEAMKGNLCHITDFTKSFDKGFFWKYSWSTMFIN